MYTEDLALNNLQGLICHKTKPNLRKPHLISKEKRKEKKKRKPTVPTDYRVRIKENEKRERYLDLARERKRYAT